MNGNCCNVGFGFGGIVVNGPDAIDAWFAEHGLPLIVIAVAVVGRSKRAAPSGSVSHRRLSATSLAYSGGGTTNHFVSGATSAYRSRCHGSDRRVALRGIHSPTTASCGTTISTEIV